MMPPPTGAHLRKSERCQWSLDKATKEGYGLLERDTLSVEFRNTTSVIQRIRFEGDFVASVVIPPGRSYVCLCNGILRRYITHRGVRIYSEMLNIIVEEIATRRTTEQTFRVAAVSRGDRCDGIFLEARIPFMHSDGYESLGLHVIACRQNHDFDESHLAHPTMHCRNNWQGRCKVQHRVPEECPQLVEIPPSAPTPPRHIGPCSTIQSTGTIAIKRPASSAASTSGSTQGFKAITMDTTVARRPTVGEIIDGILDVVDDDQSSDTSSRLDTPQPLLSSIGAEGVEVVDVEAEPEKKIDVVKVEDTQLMDQVEFHGAALVQIGRAHV